MKSAIWVGWLFGLSALVLSGLAQADDGTDVYKQVCAVCHSTGMTDTPQLGSQADWNNRMLMGRAALLRSVLAGKGAMPPKGGDASLSDSQAGAALDHMLSKINIFPGINMLPGGNTLSGAKKP